MSTTTLVPFEEAIERCGVLVREHPDSPVAHLARGQAHLLLAAHHIDVGRLAPGLPALEEAFRWDTKVIVERHVAGAREFECGVLGNEEPIVFEPGEIVSHHELYDYEAKYVPGLADVIPRAAVEPELADQLRELALAAYRAVDARGMARVDFLATPGETYLSEMNTIPGFTATSMFPKQAELAGISFSELVGRLIELAEEPPG